MTTISNLHAGVRGEYRLVVNTVHGERDTGWFDNLILDQGLDFLGMDINSLSYASIGTGTAAPTASQTSLASHTAFSAAGSGGSTVVNLGAPSYASQHTFSYTFAQGAVVGNMTEVGVGSGNTAGKLFSRALIVDTNGDPVTLTMTSIDQLTLYYRITIYPPITDHTGSFDIGGTTYNYTSRLLAAGNFAGSQFTLSPAFSQVYSSQMFGPGVTLAPITATTISGGTAAASVIHTGGSNTYVTGTHYRTWTLTHTPTQSVIVGGISGMVVLSTGQYTSMRFQFIFDKPIPKTNTQTLVLTLRFSWARA